MPSIRDHMAQSMREATDYVESALIRANTPNATVLADNAMLALAEIYGGQMIYLPKKSRLDTYLTGDFEKPVDDDSDWYEIVDDMVAVLLEMLEKKGIQKSDRNDLALVILSAMGEYYAGAGSWYLAMSEPLKRAGRDAEIYRRHSENEDIKVLAREYRLNVNHVYKIISSIRKANRQARPLLD